MELDYSQGTPPQGNSTPNSQPVIAGESSGTIENQKFLLSIPQTNTSKYQKRLDRISKISKNKQASQTQAFQLPIMIPENIPLPQQNIQNRRTSYDAQDSISSFALSQSKLQKLDKERELEQDKLFNKLQDSALDNLYEQLKQAENQQKEFIRQAHQYQNDKFQQDATEQIENLQQSLEKVMDTLKNVMKFIHQKISKLQDTTKEIFIWSFTNTQNDIHQISQTLQKQDTKISKTVLELSATDEAIDLLLQKVEELSFSQDNSADSDKVLGVCQQILQYAQSQIATVYEHVKTNKNEQQNFIQSISNAQVEYCDALKHENLRISKTVDQQQNQIQSLNDKMTQLIQYVANVEKMTKVSYFGTNMLIDNDELLKQGINESTSKQAHLMDLLQTYLKQASNQPQELPSAKQFQDSVQSLQLDKKVKLNFPNVQMIPEFMGDDHRVKDERMEADIRVYDQNREQYNQNVDEFFKRYPKHSMQFMVGKEQDTNPNIKTSGSFANEDILAKINQQLGQNTIPNPDSQSPRIRLHRRSSDKASVHQTTKPQDTTSVDKLIELMQRPTAQPRYQPVQNTQRNYHKFQFKQKYDRRTHPKIFLLQFETLAQQCDLTDQEKCLQLMFNLQGEYLDWYNARYIAKVNSPQQLTWHQLKTLFIETFTISDEEAQDDLFRITQRSGETAEDYLARLRQTVQNSDLTDDHIKGQFYSGLQNQRAKQYIYNMKQFNSSLYKKHTSTTLLKELEKQSKLFNFDLLPRKDDKSKLKPQGKKNWVQKTSTTTVKEDKPKEQRYSYNNRQKVTSSNKINNKPKVNFAQTENSHSSENEDTQTPASQEDNSDKESSASSQRTEEIFDQSNLLITGPSIPINSAQINNLQSQQEIQAGEGEQVNSLFRSNQKNTQNLTDKLVELTSKGRKLPKTDYKLVRSSTYIHLPDEQLLIETPKQFISACNYLYECLDNNDNLLKTKENTLQFKGLLESLNNRIQSLRYEKQNGSNVAQCNTVSPQTDPKDSIMFLDECYQVNIKINSVDYLCYITIQFQDKQVTALVDTGSTVTVVSEYFCKQNKIKIPQCDSKKEVTLADGSTTEMLEWKNAKITLDKYNTIYGDVLISKSKSYDMLFGLNACLAIGASLTSDFLRYHITVQGKERFGKLPIVKKTKTETL